MKCQPTQAERLFALLRRKGMTTMEMLATGISVAPWKRVVEGSHHLKPGERIHKRLNKRGLVVYSIQRG